MGGADTGKRDPVSDMVHMGAHDSVELVDGDEVVQAVRMLEAQSKRSGRQLSTWAINSR